MDFITDLPKYEVNNAITVVVDKMTKHSHCLSLTHILKASITIEEFMEIFQKLHGIPMIILSDKDLIFARNFWTEIFSYLGIQLAHISSYHTQSNGKRDCE